MTATERKLEELAYNAWWSWNPDAIALFRELNPPLFTETGNNPVAALRRASPAILNGPDFQHRLDLVYSRFRSYIEEPGEMHDAPPVAYFCMEFGIHESLPMYSGGLGILAGDHIKTASDLGLPFTGIGLLVKEGYLFQQFDATGWQQSLNPVLHVEETPLKPVLNDDGERLLVTVQIGEEDVNIAAWSLAVGNSTLFYLDTDIPENSPEARRITKRLYDNGPEIRIRQEMVLGIGGVRLLRALDVPASVYHLNEGHCSFVALELLREQLAAGAVRSEAEQTVQDQVVFTTHTPVPEGHDRFEADLFGFLMRRFADSLSISMDDLASYGRQFVVDTGQAFNMTILGLKLSRSANGVSKLNGEVARNQWHIIYNDRPVEDVPIGHVTNGIHIPTWISPTARSFVESKCGPLDSARRGDVSYWAPLRELSDEALWELRAHLRRELVDFAYRRVAGGTLPQTCDLDPDYLTIGFARRLAPYKRAVLIFSNLDRVARLFGDSERPIQMVFAGKAHPNNDIGKSFIQHITEIGRSPTFNGRVVFLENYDMEVGRMLVSGCDVWLNNPRRPMEASGTSGQKTAVHGGLNLSILDGWWPEAYNGRNGWAIGNQSDSEILLPEQQDPVDAENLYQVLSTEVVPTFYDRDDAGIPRRWTAMMREAMTVVTPQFSATRMVREYVRDIYADARAEASL